MSDPLTKRETYADGEEVEQIEGVMKNLGISTASMAAAIGTSSASLYEAFAGRRKLRSAFFLAMMFTCLREIKHRDQQELPLEGGGDKVAEQ